MEYIDILKIFLILYGGGVDKRGEKPKEILSNFPGCGQLGNVTKKECTWGCDWQNSTIDGLSFEEIDKMFDKAIESIGKKQYYLKSK